MKQVLSILIILGVFLLFRELISKYQAVKRQQSEGVEQTEPNSPPAAASSAALPALPPNMEAALEAAQKQGADGLRNFLRQYGYAVHDPRRAAIELDLALLVNLKDPTEARAIFKSVQERTPRSSPVYERVKRLEKTFH
ncbi:MAG: hypothetical protein FJ403_07515 [Verrucomicrobia bacterium]|nr:hypothetical protein [Verrucomicrobiota bacterium]